MVCVCEDPYSVGVEARHRVTTSEEEGRARRRRGAAVSAKRSGARLIEAIDRTVSSKTWPRATPSVGQPPLLCAHTPPASEESRAPLRTCLSSRAPPLPLPLSRQKVIAVGPSWSPTTRGPPPAAPRCRRGCAGPPPPHQQHEQRRQGGARRAGPQPPPPRQTPPPPPPPPAARASWRSSTPCSRAPRPPRLRSPLRAPSTLRGTPPRTAPSPSSGSIPPSSAALAAPACCPSATTRSTSCGSTR